MQTRSFLALSLLTGILIISLSSFYHPHAKQPVTPPDDDIAVSSGKITRSRGNLTVSTAFENEYYTHTNREGYFYLEVKANKFNSELHQSLPMNISLVIDRSGSMAGDKLLNAKKAAKYVVDQLGSNDYLSIITYDNSVEVLQNTTAVYNPSTIKNKIDRITDRGGTNLMGGALKGFEEVKKGFKPGYINRVLLLSDGLANEGITNPQEIVKIIRRQNAENGISISTFGVGNDYNEDLMTAMAENGTGNYYFIAHAENIAGIFEKELNGLKEVVAQNTRLQITVPEHVTVEKAYGYQFEQGGRNLYVNLHDIFSEETKGILFKYRIHSNNFSDVNFQTNISFKDVSSGRRLAVDLKNKQDFTSSQTMYHQNFNDWVSAQVALFVSNEKLEMAMKEVDKGNYQEAKKIVKENKDYMASKAPLVSKSVELQKAQDNNNEYDLNISNVESLGAEEVKYLQKSTKSTNYQIRAKKIR